MKLSNEEGRVEGSAPVSGAGVGVGAFQVTYLTEEFSQETLEWV